MSEDCEETESIQQCKKFSRGARNNARDMSCTELLDKINELTDTEKVGRAGPKGLIQRFRDYLGDDPNHGLKNILEQQSSLRTYMDEYISRGCGDPPSNAVEIMGRPLPASNLDGNTAKNAAVIGGGLGLGYLAYRTIRMLPSLLPPLWPTIPENLAIP